MPGNKPKEQNDEGWRKWYSLPENKNKYLRKKLLNRINKGEIVKLTTLRKYGLLQHYKKETTRANKRKIKEELSIEPLYYAKPEPLVIDGVEELQSIGIKPKKPAISLDLSKTPDTDDEADLAFSMPEVDDESDFDVWNEIDQQPQNIVIQGKKAPPKTNQQLLENTALPTNKRKATKILRKKVLESSKTYKVKKGEKFTFKDAFALLNNPNLLSLNQMKEYKPASVAAMKSRLRTLMRLYKEDKKILCDKGIDADIRACLGNAKTMFNILKKGKHANGKTVGYKGWKEFLGLPVALANASPKFAAILGARALKQYQKLMMTGIAESEDKQDDTVQTEVVLNWNIFKDTLKKEAKKFNKLKKDVLQNDKTLTVVEKRFIIDFLILAIPVLGVPRRDDHGNLLIVDSSKDIKNKKTQNYYLRKSKSIWLYSFKTDDKYDPPQKFILKRMGVGKQNFTAEQKRDATRLGGFIEDSLKMWKRKYVITRENGRRYAGGKLSERLQLAMRKFGLEAKNPLLDKNGKPKPIGFNTFRHSYATYIRETDEKGKARLNKRQLKNTAKQMLHSDKMNEKYLRQLVRDFNLEV